EECRWLLMNTFRSLAFFGFGAVNGYLAWLEERGEENTWRVYEEYRRQLQLLQWRRPPRHWVLKCPLHAYALDALLRLFPDSCVAKTHRDLHKVLPSLCSLRLTRCSIVTDTPDPRRVAEEATAHVTRLLRPALRARAEYPGRVYDVAYRDLLRDPIAAIRSITDRFGRPLSGAAQKAMRAWLAAHSQGEHGRHRYSLEQFGLDKGAVDHLFPDYPQCFGLPPGGTA